MPKGEKSKVAIQVAAWILRWALGSAFLVSVADRLGLLGGYGAKNVSWGDWHHFVAYVGASRSWSASRWFSGYGHGPSRGSQLPYCSPSR